MKKKLNKENYITIYKKMLQIRRFEERAAQLYGMGHIGGFCHLYIGQEAVVVGVLMTIEKNDINLEVYLPNPLKADYIKDKIGIMNNNFYVYSWIDLNKSFFSALKVERNVMFVILTLIIIVAAFNIISGLTILIKNKTREIAILKTLGLSNNSIIKSFFLTGFTIGLIATIFGITLGVLFSENIESIRVFFSYILNVEIFPSDVYFLDEMPSEISFSSIVIIFIFSITITSLASLVPAITISKMSTIKALKYE